jgi:hypothetical protein
MSYVEKPLFAVVLGMLAVCAAPVTLAAGKDSMDIVGLRLGMTPQEAFNALEAHGIAREAIQETRMSYSYSDGLRNDYRTADFLAHVTAGKRQSAASRRSEDSFVLYFSPPPDGGRLVGVNRTINNQIDPVTRGELREALIAKYGAPAVEELGVMNWRFGEGDKNCVSSRPNGTGAELPPTLSRDKKSILDIVTVTRGNQVRLDQSGTPTVKGLEDCASILEYKGANNDYTAGQPANRVSASMVDVQSWVTAELAASKYVDGLRQEAIKKREGQGKKPAL